VAHGIELSKRERQIMDVIWALNEATATRVVEEMDNPPTRTSIRTLLGILEEKGHLQHRKQGREFVYFPTRARQHEGQSAFKRVLRVFFDSSIEKALTAHLSDPGVKISRQEAKRLSEMIHQARKRGV
jgi:predicted transcriptional regulator